VDGLVRWKPQSRTKTPESGQSWLAGTGCTAPARNHRCHWCVGAFLSGLGAPSKSQLEISTGPQQRQPWNKGKLVGQKAPLKLRDIWAIRIRLQLRQSTRDLALFNLAIDSKLRACIWW